MPKSKNTLGVANSKSYLWFYLKLGGILLLVIAGCFIPLLISNWRAGTSHREHSSETQREVSPSLSSDTLLDHALCTNRAYAPQEMFPVSNPLSFFTCKTLQGEVLSEGCISKFFCAEGYYTRLYSQAIYEVMQQDAGVAEYIQFVFTHLKNFKIVVLPRNKLTPLTAQSTTSTLSPLARYLTDIKTMVFAESGIGKNLYGIIRHEFRHAFIHAIQRERYGFDIVNIFSPGQDGREIQQMLDEGYHNLSSLKILLKKERLFQEMTREETEYLSRLRGLIPLGYFPDTLSEMISLYKDAYKSVRENYSSDVYICELEAFVRECFPTELIKIIYPGLFRYTERWVGKINVAERLVIPSYEKKDTCVREVQDYLVAFDQFRLADQYLRGDSQHGITVDLEKAERLLELAGQVIPAAKSNLELLRFKKRTLFMTT